MPGIGRGAGLHNEAGGIALIESSTIAANQGSAGANLSGTGVATLSNTIVSDPRGGANCAFPVLSDGHNLESGTSCNLNKPTDLTATDPLLGVLKPNGGPTETHLPLAGSPAIDAGRSVGLTTDQRGSARPSNLTSVPNAAGGNGADIGAVEILAPPRGRCAGKRATITGTGRGDEIRGTPRRDVIFGGGGRDIISGLGGNDLICGGAERLSRAAAIRGRGWQRERPPLRPKGERTGSSGTAAATGSTVAPDATHAPAGGDGTRPVHAETARPATCPAVPPAARCDAQLIAATPKSEPELPEEHGSPSVPERIIAAGARTSIGGIRRVAGTTGVEDAIEEAVADAVIRALESPATDRAIREALASATTERRSTRSSSRRWWQGHRRGDPERAEQPRDERRINEVLESELVDRVWDKLLASDEMQRLVERIAEAPEVRAAITQQGVGLLQDVGRGISGVARRIDDTVERFARRLLRRPQRTERSKEAGLSRAYSEWRSTWRSSTASPMSSPRSPPPCSRESSTRPMRW